MKGDFHFQKLAGCAEIGARLLLLFCCAVTFIAVCFSAWSAWPSVRIYMIILAAIAALFALAIIGGKFIAAGKVEKS